MATIPLTALESNNLNAEMVFDMSLIGQSDSPAIPD